MDNLPIDIFRTYDIRGLYPDQLNKENIYLIARAFGSYFHQKNIENVVLGMDNRKSSIPLAESVKRGLLESGINVTFAGITTEPASHFFSFLDGVQAVMNITASHNPKQYNGIKVDYKNAWPFEEKEYKIVYETAIRKDFTEGKGAYSESDLNQKYIDHIKSCFEFKKPHKVVLDCGYGTVSDTAPRVLSALGINLLTENCTFDGNYPLGVPDPENIEFVKRLSQEVLIHKADLGIGFDGDGDRFGVVDHNGKIYKSDKLLMLFARDILKNYKGAKVVFDVKNSYLVDKVIRENKGVPEMIRTGRTFFLPKTLTKEALLGGEFSGHFFFADRYYGFDDGLYAACRLIEILEKENKSLSELVAEFGNTVSTPEYQIPCPDNVKFDIVSKIKNDIIQSGEFRKVLEIDGVRVITSDTSWFLIRAKNTSPFLTLRAEADTNMELMKILGDAVKYMSPYKQLDLSVI